eukprot:32976_1
MYLFLFLTLNLYWRLYQCVNVTFDINVASLIEFDENNEQVLSNAYTEFTSNDWTNTTLFKPILSNNGHLQMSISRIPSNNEFQYTIDIRNWPWYNENNSIEFCFHIIILNGNDLQFQCSTKVFIKMRRNTLDICHRFHYNEQIDIAHIYYSTTTNHSNDNTNYYPFTTNITYINHDLDTILMSSNGGKHEYTLWLFGVCMTISVIICIFISLICYLIKQGFFDDSPKHLYKRKRSTIIIGNGGYISTNGNCKRSSTNSGDTNSLPNSPKKNLRINVTYHSPRELEIMNARYNTNNLFVEDMNKDLNNINMNSNANHRYENSKTLTKTFSCDTHTRTHTKTKTNTCDTIRIIDTLMEGNEDEMDSDESNNGAITPIVPQGNGDNEFDHESSLIQYIITCSNNNSVDGINEEHLGSPVPLI